jgi:hypothetical protein
MKASFKHMLKQHKDQYKTIALSTGHLNEADVISLTNMVNSTGIATMRDTGWFLKLYELEGEDENSITVWREYYPFVNDSLLTILIEVYLAGFRMIEFDQDVEMIDELTVKKGDE